jgi:predicted MFS family arabinose efflux permease
VFLILVVVGIIYLLWMINRTPKRSSADTHATEQDSAMSSVDYVGQGQTGVIYFAIGGTLLLFAYFLVLSDLGNNDTIGGLAEYGLAFVALLLIGSGLHGILRSAMH